LNESLYQKRAEMRIFLRSLLAELIGGGRKKSFCDFLATKLEKAAKTSQEFIGCDPIEADKLARRINILGALENSN
jgi:hypothetical protein